MAALTELVFVITACLTRFLPKRLLFLTPSYMFLILLLIFSLFRLFVVLLFVFFAVFYLLLQVELLHMM
jgi:hypothetical protein